MSGEAARDAGISQVLENADEDWKQSVYSIVRALPAGWTGTGEDIRMLSSLQPHAPQAWGAVINSCVRWDWLEPTGEYRKMKDRRSHARETKVYRRTQLN